MWRGWLGGGAGGFGAEVLAEMGSSRGVDHSGGLFVVLVVGEAVVGAVGLRHGFGLDGWIAAAVVVLVILVLAVDEAVAGVVGVLHDLAVDGAVFEAAGARHGLGVDGRIAAVVLLLPVLAKDELVSGVGDHRR